MHKSARVCRDTCLALGLWCIVAARRLKTWCGSGRVYTAPTTGGTAWDDPEGDDAAQVVLDASDSGDALPAT